MTLRKANEHRNAWFEGVQKCHLDETLFTVMERIVRAEVHRLVVVDENEKVIGIISLSDILLYLVLRPSGDGVGGNEQSLRASDPIAKKVSSLDGSDSLSNSRSIDNIEEEEHEDAAAAQLEHDDDTKVTEKPVGRGERRISEVTGVADVDEVTTVPNGGVEEGEAATEEGEDEAAAQTTQNGEKDETEDDEKSTATVVLNGVEQSDGSASNSSLFREVGVVNE